MKDATKHTKVESGSYPPAKDSDEREDQLIALAYDLVEKRLREGTATSQETVHFLKAGSKAEKLNKELTETQIELGKAKKEALQSARRVEELYNNAVKAFASYNGATPSDLNDDDH